MNALTNVDEEQMKEVPIEKLIKETNGLIRAAAYKKRIEVQNRDNYEAGLEAVKSLVFEAMAKEKSGTLPSGECIPEQEEKRRTGG